MTPLETQLLNALRLRRATSWPFAPAPYGLGLERTEENGSTTAWARRNAEADKAVDDAIRAGEAHETGSIIEGGWRQVINGQCPVVDTSTPVDIRLRDGLEYGGLKARSVVWENVPLWRPAV